MGNNHSSSTKFELLARRDMLETNMKTVNFLLKQEYQKTPVNLEKVRGHKRSIEKITKQIGKLDSIIVHLK